MPTTCQVLCNIVYKSYLQYPHILHRNSRYYAHFILLNWISNTKRPQSQEVKTTEFVSRLVWFLIFYNTPFQNQEQNNKHEATFSASVVIANHCGHSYIHLKQWCADECFQMSSCASFAYLCCADTPPTINLGLFMYSFRRCSWEEMFTTGSAELYRPISAHSEKH